MAELEAHLKTAQSARRIFIVTDGVFSMEGSVAPLREIVTLARHYNAAIILDDSHGVGVMGKHGRGTAEYFDVEADIDIYTGTLGKALGGAGRRLCRRFPRADRLPEPGFAPQLFSNALPATICGSALKAIQILEAEPETRRPPAPTRRPHARWAESTRLQTPRRPERHRSHHRRRNLIRH